MNNPFHRDGGQSLLKALTRLRNSEETAEFLGDLLSPKEIQNIVNRWRAVELLDQKESYLDIQRQTGLSSATVAKMSTALKFGTGMLKKVIARI